MAIAVLVTLVSPFSTESFWFPFSIVLRCDVQLFGSNCCSDILDFLDFEVSFSHFGVHFIPVLCRKQAFSSCAKRNFVKAMAASPTAMSVLALMPTPCKPESGLESETWVRLVRSDFYFKIFSLKESYLYRICFYNLMFSNVDQFFEDFFQFFSDPDWLK